MNISVVTTSADNSTSYVDGEGQYWPCPCGEDHRGDYGIEDYMHHTCLHDQGWGILVDQGPITDTTDCSPKHPGGREFVGVVVICYACGRSVTAESMPDA